MVVISLLAYLSVLTAEKSTMSLSCMFETTVLKRFYFSFIEKWEL